MITGRWQTNFVITAVVLFTVVIAFLLAQLDVVTFDADPAPIVAVPVIEATDTAVPPTETVLPVVPIPTSTPSPTATEVNENETPTSEPIASPKNTNTPIPDSQIPCIDPPANWVPYIVKSGDTLLSISITFGATQEELSQYNCLASRSVAAGMMISVPNVPPTVQPCGIPPNSWRSYSVKRGDTLFSLARFRGVTVYAVMNANCLKTTALFAGQIILLPPQTIITATPFPSSTATPTETITGTATATPLTPTATSTADGTITPSATSTPTATGSMTPTPSETPMTTGTPDVTKTPDPTAETTAVPTEESTPMPTAESTPMPTQESTPMPTEAPTEMPTTPPTPPPTEEPPPEDTPTAIPDE